MTAPGQTWSSQPYLDHISAGPASHHSDAFDEARQHTQQPIVTGTSILALKYKDGIMMASDTLASYGSLSRFMDVRRIIHVEGANSIVGAGGDMSDFQYIQHSIDKLM
jgi:20S proteasome subunit beta 7